ncbi:MAG: hypothetical protein WC435_03170 [Candidatus Paceibacterota bacterium]
MEKEIFKQIKKKYGNYASFAIWGKDLNNVNIIEKNVEILHGKIVFVGLNISKSINKFQNFHFKHKGGRDNWLKELLNDSFIFKGAYMTDIIKNNISSRQNKLKMSDKEKEKNLELFEKELIALNTKPELIAFGNKTYKLLDKIPEKLYKDRYKVSHYASWIKKNDFFREVKKVENKILSKNK